MAAATAVGQAQKNVEKLTLGAKSSAILKTTGMIAKSVSAADGLQSALSSITAKLEVLVLLGDEIATVMPLCSLYDLSDNDSRSTPTSTLHGRS